MEELIVFLFYLVLIAIAIAAYLAALAAYTVVVAPLAAAGAALFCCGSLLAGYAVAVHGVLLARPPRFQVLPGYRPEDEPESAPAYRQYFFGPAVRDLRQIAMITWRTCRDRGAGYQAWVWRRFMTGRGADGLAIYPLGLTLWLGLFIGAVAAGGLLAAALAVHAAAVLTIQLLARAAIGVLREADTVVLRLKGINGMMCPSCHRRVAFPRYRCPGCSRMHSDVRPGRYGVLRRRCQCGHKLRTLLIVGSYRQPAFCTECGRQMSDETGRFGEIVLPLLGGIGAGKTRLMAAMITSLHEVGPADADGPAAARIRLADDETRRAYEVLSEVLGMADGYTKATPPADIPRAHSVLVEMPRYRRLLHIFDASGERFTEADKTEELRYLPAARTYLFVIDPLSVPAFWDQLTPGERDAIDPLLVSPHQPWKVFEQSVQTMIGMGGKVERSRLAVAISKTDLVTRAGILAGREDGSDWAERWLVRSLDQRNLVQAMRNEFSEVRFFFTAAVLSGDGHVDGSVRPLVTWCLRDSRARLRWAGGLPWSRRASRRSPAWVGGDTAADHF